VVFPLEILPVSSLLSSLMFSVFGLSLVLIGRAVFYHGMPWTVVLLPLVILPVILMGLGLSWFLASLTVFVRDVGNLTVVIVSQFLLFLTPIFFTLENVPEPWRSIAGLNPLAPVVSGAANVVVDGVVPPWQGLVAAGVFGLLTMQLGYAWFMKSKRGFADVL
ncbi:MAG: ABC transporter permease, partial [Phycisphaerales bacterium]|jgi:lipopolysaccharide transport system permease protein